MADNDEIINQWSDWLWNNPDADTHQRYYAMGVIDGLRFVQGRAFKPEWSRRIKDTGESVGG